MSEPCPTCGSPVTVEGSETLYYVPDRSEVEALKEALRLLYAEASTGWDERDIRNDSSYAQLGGYIRARTLFAAHAALAASGEEQAK